jgi:hypothetical protein
MKINIRIKIKKIKYMVSYMETNTHQSYRPCNNISSPRIIIYIKICNIHYSQKKMKREKRIRE